MAPEMANKIYNVIHIFNRVDFAVTSPYPVVVKEAMPK
jgi:hypothetical protein